LVPHCPFEPDGHTSATYARHPQVMQGSAAKVKTVLGMSS